MEALLGTGRSSGLGTCPRTKRDEATDKAPVAGIMQLGQSETCSQAIKPTRFPWVSSFVPSGYNFSTCKIQRSFQMPTKFLPRPNISGAEEFWALASQRCCGSQVSPSLALLPLPWPSSSLGHECSLLARVLVPTGRSPGQGALQTFLLQSFRLAHLLSLTHSFIHSRHSNHTLLGAHSGAGPCEPSVVW